MGIATMDGSAFSIQKPDSHRLPASPSSVSSEQCQSPVRVDPISHIRVVVRIRPMDQDEAKRGCKRAVAPNFPCTETPKAEKRIFSRLRSSFSSPVATDPANQARPSFTSPERLDEGMVLSENASSNKNNNSHMLLQRQTSILPTSLTTVSSTGTREFDFDAVFGPMSNQQFVYEHALPNMARNLFSGYNTTILAYGQTGSGKVSL